MYSHKQKDGKGRATITREEIMLIHTRAKLAAVVHATYQDNLTKGSDAWRAHQVAKRALDDFDLAHPGVVVELYEQFEAYQQAKGGER